MKKTILILLCIFIALTAFAEKTKVIPIVITTNKIIKTTTTATPTVRLPLVIEEPVEHTATPTASLTADIGGNQ